MTLSTLAVFLGNIALRSLIVCALAELALWILHRRGASAATRHLALLATFAALLVLPLFSLTLPALPIAAPHFVTASVNATTTTIPAAVPSMPIVPQNKAAVVIGESKPAPEVAPAAVAPASKPEATPVIPPSHPVLPLATLIATIYLIGAGLLCLRHLVALAGIAIYGRTRCRTVTAPTPLALLRRLAPMRGRTAHTRLIEPRPGDSANAAFAAPVTWGFFRPMLLLPSATTAVEWPEEQLTSLIRHELAHIQRGDWAVQRLAQLLCALYWFQPWIYSLAKRLDAAAECACDDAVLQSGVGAPEYGEHLLSVARTVRQASMQRSLWSGLSQNAALGMARPTSNIEARLTALLLAARDRRPVGRRVLVGAFAVALAIVAPVAAAHWRAVAAIDKSADTSRDGLRVTLLGIETNSPAKGEYWWAPDGRRLAHAPDAVATTHRPDSFGALVSWSDPRDLRRFLRFRIETAKPLSEPVSVVGFITAPESVLTNMSLQKGRFGVRENDVKCSPTAPATGTTRIALLAGTHRFTYRFGVATGPWQTISMLEPLHPTDYELKPDSDGGGVTYGPIASMDGPPNISYQFRDGSERNQTFDIPYDHRLGDVARRLVARDIHGNIVPLQSDGISQGDTFYSLSGALLRRIHSLTLQTRPYHWFVFADIPVESGAPMPKGAVGIAANGTMRGLMPTRESDTPAAYVQAAIPVNSPRDPGAITRTQAKSGVTIALESVSRVLNPHRIFSWRPQGTPLDRSPEGVIQEEAEFAASAARRPQSPQEAPQNVVTFAFHTQDTQNSPGIAIQNFPANTTPEPLPLIERLQQGITLNEPHFTRNYSMDVSPANAPVTLRVNVASGPWQTIATRPMTFKPTDFPAPSPADTSQHHVDLTFEIADSPTLSWRDAHGVDRNERLLGDTHRTIPANVACRLIAVDDRGRTHALYAAEMSSAAALFEFSFHHSDEVANYNSALDLSHVREFRLQTRPYESTDFASVAFSPAK